MSWLLFSSLAMGMMVTAETLPVMNARPATSATFESPADMPDVAATPLATTLPVEAPLPVVDYPAAVTAPIAALLGATGEVTAPVSAALGDVTAPTAATAPVYAPEVNFAGRLLERGTRTPVPDAQIVVTELGIVAFTDRAGYFEFEDLPGGEYTIVVPVIGYQRLMTTENISETVRIDVVYYIEPLLGSPLAVIVEADKVKKEVSKTVLSRKEIKSVAGTGGDAIKVVATLPGVATSNELGTDLIIRGSGPFDNRIEIDRVAVPYVYHFGGLRSVLHEELVASVDFQAGGFSSLFGRATGGVLLTNLREGRTDRYGGSLNVNTLLSEGYMEGPIGDKGSFIVAGRRSYIDLIMAPIVRATVPAEDLTFSVFPQFYDYQARFDYGLTTGATLTASIFGADDILKLLLGRSNPRDPDLTGSFFLHQQFHVPSLTLTTTGGRWKNRASLYYLYQRNDIEIGERGSFLNIGLGAPGFNNDASYQATETHTLNFGTQLRLDRVTFASRFPQPPRPGETDFTFTDAVLVDYERVITGGQAGVYAEDVIKLAPNWIVVPGVRFEYHKQDRGYHAVDPRFTTRWDVTEGTALKAAVGKYSDFPSPQQLDPEFGNRELDPFHAIHYVAGLEQKITDADTVDVQAYYKEISGLVYRMAQGSGNYENSVLGEAYGFEIFYRRYLTTRLYGWISYAYARSFRKYPDQEHWIVSPYDQPHIANFVANYRLSNRWEAGLRWRYNSGEPHTPLVDRIYIADKGFYVPIPGERYSERRPAQHRMDARVAYAHPFRTWTLETYLEVLNVYGAENVANYSNNYDYTVKEPIVILPIPVPVLGVRAEF